jgi:hypothetical protein
MNRVCSILILCLFWKCLTLQTSTTQPKTSITSRTEKNEVTTLQTILSTSNIPTTSCKINGSCFVNSSLTANLTTVSSPTNSTAENSSISRNSSVAAPTKISNLEKKHVPSLSSVTDLCVCDLKVSLKNFNLVIKPIVENCFFINTDFLTAHFACSEFLFYRICICNIIQGYSK